MSRNIVIAVGVILATLLVCGGFGALTGSTEEPEKSPQPTPDTPPAPYELIEDAGLLTMRVTTDHTGALGAAFRELARRVLDTYPEDGYFVQVDCAIDGQNGRLGNGKIAVGTMGAARTGLPVDGQHIEWLTGKHCRPGYVEPTVDLDRKLDSDYVLELCLGRIEDKYTADHLPVALSDVDITESKGWWTVTGKAQGENAPSVEFTCQVWERPGMLRVGLTRFGS